MITNIHVHTPFSFSAFKSIRELVDTAAVENVAILGINDLNTAEGFREFSECCRSAKIYPIFNIEFKIEDDVSNRFPTDGKPFTPFFTGEFSGKALPFPHPFPADIHNLIASIWKGSQDRIWKMIELLNEHLAGISIPVNLEYTKIRSRYARTSVYEQHIAGALVDAVNQKAATPEQKAAWYRQLLDNPQPAHPETELVNKLLTTGKPGSVRVSPDLSLTMAQARQLILQIGGIPCYQCRLGSTASPRSGMSAEHLADHLVKRGIHAIEFIPQQSNAAILRSYMSYFHEKHFCVSIGTGHHTTFSRTTIPVTDDGKQLDEDLLTIGYEGACILAAHQEHRVQKQPGYLDENGMCIISADKLPSFIAEGNAIIHKIIT